MKLFENNQTKIYRVQTSRLARSVLEDFENRPRGLFAAYEFRALHNGSLIASRRTYGYEAPPPSPVTSLVPSELHPISISVVSESFK